MLDYTGRHLFAGGLGWPEAIARAGAGPACGRSDYYLARCAGPVLPLTCLGAGAELAKPLALGRPMRIGLLSQPRSYSTPCGSLSASTGRPSPDPIRKRIRS